MPLLEAPELDRRTTLLSPFDPLIHDRERTAELFGFEYRTEIYVPKTKRRFGYYVMPVLQGEQLVARIDPFYDRKGRILRIKAVHRQPDRHLDEEALGEALDSLAAFLGADRVVLPA